MPKLTRNFTQGKMNKDLDSRLIPPGQYRDALNIQVATSEGSDVGAVQNILGTTLTTQRKSASIVWQTNLGFGSVNPKIIGICKDSLNDKIYYFVTDGSNSHAIMEYSLSTNYLLAVIADVRTSGNVLNFSEDYPITGVNILDGILFWTDDLNEPKRLNIQRYIDATNASLTDRINATTSIYSREFNESDITVIRKSPKKKITLDISSTLSAAGNNNRGAGTNPIILNPVNFNQGGVGEFPKTGDVVLTWGESQRITPLSAFENKKVILTGEKKDENGIAREYIITGTLKTGTFTSSSEVVGNYIGATITVDVVPRDVPNESMAWRMVLDETEYIYKNEMPRFSYRWKYVDGEYSTYAPFSDVAFLPGKYDYSSFKGENNGMRNHARKITLTLVTGTDTTFGPPKDVEYVEILYKSASSNNIQVIKTHDLGTGDISTLEITSELSGPTVESLQLLRPFDNVPRKAKAQEIIGNRVVYGNYLQNYNVDADITISASPSATTFPSGQTGFGLASLKSNRTYQIGVSFLDDYNRESPVFTDENASVTIPFINSNTINQLAVSVSSSAPSWATFYKYYIKEISNPYYNLSLDRFYTAEDGNIWLGFPSSERNKISEEDYIVLKKQHDTDVAVTDNTEYKVIDIKNEAPDFIKKVFKPAGRFNVGMSTSNLFSNTSKTQQFFGPQIAKNPEFAKLLEGGNRIQFISGNKSSSIYEIESGGLAESEDSTTTVPQSSPHNAYNKYKVVLVKKGLDDNDDFLLQITDAVFECVIFSETDKDQSQFLGKFFVKIKNSNSIQNDIVVPAFNSETTKVIKGENIQDNMPVNPLVTFFDPGPFSVATYSNYVPKISFEDTNANPTGDGDHPNDGDDSFTLCFGPIEVANDPYGVDIDFNGSNAQFVFNNLLPGAKIRFKKDGNEGKVYTVTTVTASSNYTRIINGVTFTYKLSTFEVERNFEDGFTNGDVDRIELLELDPDYTFISTNPAIFETVPKKNIDLDIYYEATNARSISSLGSTATLNYFNSYAFGNGVESDRVRDDFNNVTIGKGVRVSSVLLEPYAEERLGASLIYSGILNTRSGINNSNQFTTAIDITKDLPNTYGGIQKLHARDTNLIVFCEDKVFSVQANKNALFSADGNPNVTASSNVLGQTMPFAGEFGISKNPESFASYGFRAYFTDKARGKVLRLSRDGLTDISSKGMTNFFEDKFRDHTGRITGSYDENMGTYNVHFVGDESLAFKEQVDGWPSRLSYAQPCAVSLNNAYYSINNGLVWKHTNSSSWNTFYGNFYNSSVTFFFNDAADKVKNFKTLSYQGDANWGADISDSLNKGEVTGWKEREGLYFNFIKGTSATWVNSSQTGTLDLKDFSVQGIGDIESVSSLTNVPSWEITFAETPNVSIQTKGDSGQSGDYGDVLYISNNSGKKQVGEILNVTDNVIEVSYDQGVTPVAGDYAFFAKNRIVNTSGIVGFAPKVKMTLAATNARTKKELFAVSSEIFISSE